MEHTKSKWKVSSSFLVCDEEARIIANCQPIGVEAIDIPVHEAIENAKLIAAAPETKQQRDELLETCTEVLTQIEFSYKTETGYAHFTPVQRMLRQVIKKAERKEIIC